MTISLADRRSVPEAAGLPERLTFKTAENASSLAGGVLDIDEAKGIVTAIVSVTGVVDEVADIIVPGAYAETLQKRRPKVCWAHAWEHPIGKVLDIEEFLPGDGRLPTHTRDGKAWPREAGALVASMQFNLRSTEGKDAFEFVQFFSDSGECEYSIGYNVPPGDATKSGGIRYIKALDLYELSVVLFGAHTMTGTLSIKAAIGQASKGLPALTSTGLDLAALTKAKPNPFAKKDERDDDPVEDEPVDEPTEEPEAPKPDDAPEQPDFSDGVMVAIYPDPAAMNAIAAHLSGPDATTDPADLHVTLAYLGKVGESLTEQEIVDAVTRAVEGQEVLEGEVGGIGQFPAGDEGTPTWAPVDVPGLNMLREQIVGELGDAVYNDHGFTPHMTLGYDIGLIEAVPPTPIRVEAIHVVYGESHREVPLGTPVIEAKAAAYDPALDLKAPFEGLSIAEVVRLTAIESLRMEGKAEGGADRNRGGAEDLRRYWTVGEGGAKIAWGTSGDFTRCVGFLSEHMTPERAKGYCANRHKEVTGMWPGDRDNKADDLTPEVKSFPHLEGSLEERQQAVRQAIQGQYEGEVDDRGYSMVYVDMLATYDSSAIYTVMHTREITNEAEHFLVTYALADDGTVVLGEPEPVDLRVTPTLAPSDDDGIADSLPLAETIMGLVAAVKSAHVGVMQTKAGRVLSAANARALRAALQNLVDVLGAAGIEVTEPNQNAITPSSNGGVSSDPRIEPDTVVDRETTSPEGSRTKSMPFPSGEKYVLDQATIDEDFAVFDVLP